MKWIFATVFVFNSFAFAAPGMTDGNTLLKACNAAVQYDDTGKTSGTAADVGYCYGFVEGVRNVLAIWRISANSHHESGPHVCMPNEGIENGQAARIIVKYLKDHPEELHEFASLLAMEAFQNAFPCR
jgi:hypothetical protein